MKCIFVLLAISLPASLNAQIFLPDKSVARNWNEVLLEAIRRDFARPTVHARNLFHVSAAMYDAWAFYDNTAEPFLLGNSVGGYACSMSVSDMSAARNAASNVQTARETAISYAAYRLLSHRFANSPGFTVAQFNFDHLMSDLGFDKDVVTTDFGSGSAAALGNYIANCYIQFGLQDGSNEQGSYANQFYQPLNSPLDLSNPLNPVSSGNPNISDPDRWQPLQFAEFIDQSGNTIPGRIPPALSPEWGSVVPFSLTDDDRTVYTRDGDEYWVYHDPGKPALISASDPDALPDEYRWNHELVAIWSSHLDASDNVMWDISPGCIGDSPPLPTTIVGLRNFYDLENGNRGGNDGSGACSDPVPGTGTGRAINPVTGLPYTPQVVPRGDYTRVLAEFWADGPDSETPPGHWFSILNHAVNDHPLFEKRFEGAGTELNELEWDVKAYLALGGTMHDVAITAWGIKGWYDYVRPISAIRYMAEQGQDAATGLPLVPGYVEVIEMGDPLAGVSNENVGEIKVFAWKGHPYIDDPAIDTAGVGWILAKDWWSYQRPSFVTPPFPGYVSGHSTFSRAAAEALTLLTGTQYFPGGMAEFEAEQDSFLVFEKGPSVDVVLQWATYQDASDQTSLSRIWGGIHPPVDDIPGRHIGLVVGPEAFNQAKAYFEGTAVTVSAITNDPPPSTSGGGSSSGSMDGLSLWLLGLLGVIGVWFRRIGKPERRNAD